MWRVVGVLTIIASIWGIGSLLPTSDEAGHVAASVSIATEGRAELPETASPTATEASPPLIQSGAYAPADLAAPDAAAWKTTIAVQTQVGLTDAAARMKLVMALQRELRRVGCYSGRVSGDWTRKTRNAVAAFADRVNLARATEQPDPVMLRLVATYPNIACGAPCATGQAPDAQGRCQAGAQTASAAAPRGPVGEIAWSDATITAPTKGAEGSGGDGGPFVVATSEGAGSSDEEAASSSAKKAAPLAIGSDAFAPESGAAVSQGATAGTDSRKKKRSTVIAYIGVNGVLMPVTTRKSAARKSYNAPTYALGNPSRSKGFASSREMRVTLRRSSYKSTMAKLRAEKR